MGGTTWFYLPYGLDHLIILGLQDEWITIATTHPFILFFNWTFVIYLAKNEIRGNSYWLDINAIITCQLILINKYCTKNTYEILSGV